ncbi:hypothetical protein Q9F39_004242 [Vibrio fluvialis]|nr:hypothetical protein [Vibrio fluvialis]
MSKEMDLIDKLARILNLTETCAIAAGAKGENHIEGTLMEVGDQLHRLMEDLGKEGVI